MGSYLLQIEYVFDLFIGDHVQPGVILLCQIYYSAISQPLLIEPFVSAHLVRE